MNFNLQRSDIQVRETVWSVQMDPSKAGRFPTVVYLHGFLGSGDVFLPLLNHMDIDVNPVLIDLPGHGSTKYPNEPKRYQLPQQMLDLRTLLDQVVDGPFFLYGYSMGGRLALRYALSHQNHLKGLILESTSHGIQGLGMARDRVSQDVSRSVEILRGYPDFLEQWNSLPMFVGGQPDQSDLDSYLAIQSNQDPVGIANSLLGFSAGLMPDVRARLKSIEVPVLLFAGGYDAAYVRSAALMASLIPDCQKAVISSAAHRVHLDAPDQVAGQLTTFIQKHH